MRDCLANELNQQPDLQQRLSEQALSYLSANNRPRHAVRCAIRWGNDQQRRAVACQYHNLLLNQGRNQLLEALLSTLSERPFELAVSHAWCLLENSDNNNLSPTLMQLRAKAKPDDREAQGQLDALEAYLCWLGRDLNQALRLTERALTALSNESFAHSKAEQIALSIMHELGDIEQAERRIQPLLANAVCNEQIGHALWAYAKQAWFLADRSLFEPALHLAQAGLAMLEQHDADGLLNNKIYELHHIAIEMLFNLDRLEQAWTQLQQARPLAAECAGQAPARLAILEYNLLIMQEQFEQIPALITQLERSRPLAHIGGLLVFVDGVLTDWWQRTQNKASLHAWLLQKEHVEGEIGRKHGFDVAQLAKAHWGIQSLPQAYDYSDQFLQFSAQLGERLMQIYALDLAIRMRHTHTESASKLGLWMQELADLCIQIDYITVFRKSAAFYRSMLTQLPAGLSEPAQAFLKRVSQALSMNSSAAELSASLATDAITPTEFKVLKLIKRGYSNRQICDSLHISEATLKSHINRSYKKLGVNNRREAKLLLEAVH